MVTDAGKLRIEAETENGSVVLTARGYRLNGEEIEIPGVVGVNQFTRELEHFVDAIENGTPLWVTVEDNWRVQKLIEDCRAVASAPAGRTASRTA